MYYCNKCERFMLPKFSEETYTDVCSNCESEDIERANECGICKLPIKSDKDYCETCVSLAEHYILEMSVQLETTTNKAIDLLMAVMEKEK